MEDELPPWATSVSKLLVKLSSFSGEVFLSLRSDYDPTYVSGPSDAEEDWEAQPIEHGPSGGALSEPARILNFYGSMCCYTLGTSEPWQC